VVWLVENILAWLDTCHPRLGYGAFKSLGVLPHTTGRPFWGTGHRSPVWWWR